MKIISDMIGLFDHADIIGRMVSPDTGDQFLIQYLGTGKICRCLQFLIVRRLDLHRTVNPSNSQWSLIQFFHG